MSKRLIVKKSGLQLGIVLQSQFFPFKLAKLLKYFIFTVYLFLQAICLRLLGKTNLRNSVPFWAITEMVPDLILGPDFFGPQEIWSPRISGPAWNLHVMIFMRGPNFLGTKFLGNQIFWGPNFFRSKFLKDQISWGSKKSGAQMRLGTISDIATFRAKNIGRLYFSSYHVCTIWWTERHPFLFIM